MHALAPTSTATMRAASGASAGFSGRLSLAPRAPTPALVAPARRRRPAAAAASPIDQAAAAAGPAAAAAPAPAAEHAAAEEHAAATAPTATATQTTLSSSPPNPLLPKLKRDLRDAVAGLDRGIFGAPSARRERADAAARALEALNPTPAPLTERMDLVAGEWRLLYTTVTIAGVRKTRLGLREFVKLGVFAQRIDAGKKEAVNEIGFSVSGLGAALEGSLTVRATYEVVSPQRVAIAFAGSTLAPSRLEALFRANYDLLLSIFNPDGWLDVTYVDEELRIGRDDKGHLFVLERA
jgi:hypothetical protein